MLWSLPRRLSATIRYFQLLHTSVDSAKAAVTEKNLGNGFPFLFKMGQHLLNFVIVPLRSDHAVHVLMCFYIQIFLFLVNKLLTQLSILGKNKALAKRKYLCVWILNICNQAQTKLVILKLKLMLTAYIFYTGSG